jgi:glycosyltransferase involved in cell wall biosynthesis
MPTIAQPVRHTRHPRVLLVAFHFPPLAGSSGIQRTLRLAQQLPAHGWEPIVLSASPSAYERTSDDLLDDVPASVVVKRALAFDAARQLSLRGRYIAATARPDRWVSWRFDAVRQGLSLIREHQPEVIWSTYPIATAHLIGARLAQRSGLPWVADFRDPMAQQGYPADPVTHAQFVRIEHEALQRAAVASFTTPGAAADYARRYPAFASRIAIVENGYDEASFAGVDADAIARRGPLNPGALTLLHSGIVYPSERDPTQLMVALRRLLDRGLADPKRLKLRFRAAVADDLLQRLAAEHGVSDFIETLPPVPYKQALEEMLRADALLVMQADNCNEQIPAKIYEYLRAGRPILGLAAPEGDTASVLRNAGVSSIAALESADAVTAVLASFVESLTRGTVAPCKPEAVRAASREARTRTFAQIFERAAGRGTR